MKFKYRVLYKIPLEENDHQNPDTWRKVFLLTKYDCPSELDLSVKINQLVQDYNMDKQYVILQNLEDNTEYYYYAKE